MSWNVWKDWTQIAALSQAQPTVDIGYRGLTGHLVGIYQTRYSVA